MKDHYEKLSSGELLKQRALGTDNLNNEAHKVIEEILNKRGVLAPPLQANSTQTKQKTFLEPSFVIAAAMSFFVAIGIFQKAIRNNRDAGSAAAVALVTGLFLFAFSYFIIKRSLKKSIESAVKDIDKDRDNINAKVGKEGFTELMAASLNIELTIIERLVAGGENINAIDNNGYTALMYASSNGRTEVVRTLLVAGANKSIKTQKGNTALDFAKKYKHYEIIELLKS